MVHHVASVYPVEIHLANLVAAGQPITGVTWDAVDTMDRDHAKENDRIAKEATLALLPTNSAAAAATIRAFSDEELDRAGGGTGRRGTLRVRLPHQLNRPDLTAHELVPFQSGGDLRIHTFIRGGTNPVGAHDLPHATQGDGLRAFPIQEN